MAISPSKERIEQLFPPNQDDTIEKILKNTEKNEKDTKNFLTISQVKD